MKTVSKKLFSLLLVAILLVSAVPFQAFAEEHDPAVASHADRVWGKSETEHWQECTNDKCDLYGSPLPGTTTAHQFDKSTKACQVCGQPCAHKETIVVDKVDATCVKSGFSGNTVCRFCEQLITAGSEIPATGAHTYVNHVCSVCGTPEKGVPATLTLKVTAPGTVNGASQMIIDFTTLTPISVLPDAFMMGYTFEGWHEGSETGPRISLGQVFESSVVAYAHFVPVTEQLTVRVVRNGDMSTAKTIYTENVPVGTPLLNYLNTHVTSMVKAELALTPGFSWQYNFWKDFSGTQPLTDQTTCMNQAQTVYVNFVSNAYTLYFNANGGAVTPASKSVYFGSPVGVLPTASMSGKVFQGWKDANGNLYTADTVYKVAGDTSLTAVWKDEALVILYVYINGDFSSCNRMIVMDGFVKGNNLSRSDVVSQVSKYYAPASGYLNIAGLFDEYAWSSYRANTGKAGVENLQIDSAHPNKIYVMVTNAKTGATIVNGATSNTGVTYNNGTYITSNGNTVVSPLGAYWVSTGNGTGYWVYPAANTNNSPVAPTYIYYGTNPKTGDNAMIEIAAAVMVLAAGALVTIMTLRKKKMI